MSKKKKEKQAKPTGYNIDIHINEFGELEHSFDIDKINAFLNENTNDWRLKTEDDEQFPIPDEEE